MHAWMQHDVWDGCKCTWVSWGRIFMWITWVPSFCSSKKLICCSKVICIHQQGCCIDASPWWTDANAFPFLNLEFNLRGGNQPNWFYYLKLCAIRIDYSWPTLKIKDWGQKIKDEMMDVSAVVSVHCAGMHCVHDACIKLISLPNRGRETCMPSKPPPPQKGREGDQG
jgi:hypothetical protein